MLGESAIKEYLAKGLLIKDGATGKVRGSSYPCHAARVMPGGPGDPGSEAKHHDWTGVTDSGAMAAEVCRIAPRQIVWVRIRETVRLPLDVCAFWWQTNSLSRKGLMLVNMSMVDAGYEGPLACLFVNFGREPVDIDPGMTIARLVFQKLDGLNSPYGPTGDVDAYDRELRDVALHGPSSFLSFQEFQTTFAGEKDKALAEFSQAKDQSIADMKTDVANQVKDSFREATDNLPKFLLRSSAVAFVGVALLTLALTAAHWLVDPLSLQTAKEIAAVVEADIGRRFEPVEKTDSNRTDALEQRVRQLEQALKQSPAAPPSGKPDAGH